MEAFERRNLVRWQGAEGAAVQAPSTFRDADQRARDPAETIAVAYFLRLGPTVLSAPASLNPCHQLLPFRQGRLYTGCGGRTPTNSGRPAVVPRLSCRSGSNPVPR